MSNVTYLDVGRVSWSVKAREAPARAKPCVFLRELPNGMWIVHDEVERKGGCFRDRTAALRFVSDAYGADAVPVIRPRFPRAEQHPLPSVARHAAAAH